MKINIKIWIVIIIVSSLIIIMDKFHFGENKKFTFEREFKKSLSVKIDKRKFDPQIKDYNNIILGEDYIITYNLSSKDSLANRCELIYYDITKTQKVKSIYFVIPKSSRISSCTSEDVYYIDKFQLYRFSIKENKHRLIDVPGLKVSKMVPVKNERASVLCLGEIKKGSSFVTGFFTVNTGSKKLYNITHIIELNQYPTLAQNTLKYSGNFTVCNDKSIAYNCDKYSKIFFFDSKGYFAQEIDTKDRTPLPKLVTNNNTYYYKRGKTFITNNGVVKDSNNVIIFSSRTDNTKEMTIDIYAYDSGKYLSSYEFPFENKVCADINFVSANKKMIFLAFDEGVAILNYSFKK